MIISHNSEELAALIYEHAQTISVGNKPYLVAIDGPCASGKTVLSNDIRRHLKSISDLRIDIVEMDHFFLPPALRSEDRFAEPGGNIHYERFLQEIIRPLTAHQALSYQVFNCAIMDYDGKIELEGSDIILIEGVYSQHPLWRDNLKLKLFCTAELDIRLSRIEKRDGQKKLECFINEWIPLEDGYFEAFNVKARSDIIFQSDFSRLV